MNELEKRKYIFGTIFLLANKLQVVGDKYLDNNMTTKQWFLTAMISQFGDTYPSLSEVAHVMGSSRQNVKQLALKLHKNKFLEFDKHPKDARVTTLRLTEEFNKYWQNRKDRDHQYVLDLFTEFTEEEVDIIFKGFNKLLKSIELKDSMVSKKERNLK